MDPKTKQNVSDQFELDKEDLLYFIKLSPEEKLNYLEKLVLGLREITPPAALEMNQKLRELGF